MEIRKIIGTLFLVVSLIASSILLTRAEFSIQIQAWTSFKYYIQLAPYLISLMLFYSGVCLIKRSPQSNLSMAIFGYTILELLSLDLIGISSNDLGTTTTVLFGCCALLSLWMSHANSFNLKRLSSKEILLSIFVGELESIILYYLNRID